MRIVRGLDQWAPSPAQPVVTIGNFDGVHLGHQTIFRRVAEAARDADGIPTAVTFDPHPATVLAPEQPFPLLQTPAQRERAVAACGIAVLVVQPFTAAFARRSAEAFFDTAFVRDLRARRIVVGHDFTFGAHRSGRVEHLAALGRAHGIAVEVVEPVFAGGAGETLISSTAIRRAVREGRIAAAAAMLGRPYAIEGAVVRGRGIGKQLGYPTVNCVPENALVPPEGIYVTTATIGERPYPAATYIGRNPTFGGTTLVVETFLLDFAGEMSADRIEVAFHDRLRDDIRFASREALTAQIAKDVAAARAYHSDPCPVDNSPQKSRTLL